MELTESYGQYSALKSSHPGMGMTRHCRRIQGTQTLDGQAAWGFQSNAVPPKSKMNAINLCVLARLNGETNFPSRLVHISRRKLYSTQVFVQCTSASIPKELSSDTFRGQRVGTKLAKGVLQPWAKREHVKRLIYILMGKYL